MNVAWGVPRSQLFVSQRVYGVVIMLIFGALFVLTMLYSAGLLLTRVRQVPLASWYPPARLSSGPWVVWASSLVSALVPVLGFGVMYRTMPRTRVRWRDVWAGALIAGLAWEAGKQL